MIVDNSRIIGGVSIDSELCEYIENTRASYFIRSKKFPGYDDLISFISENKSHIRHEKPNFYNANTSSEITIPDSSMNKLFEIVDNIVTSQELSKFSNRPVPFPLLEIPDKISKPFYEIKVPNAGIMAHNYWRLDTKVICGKRIKKLIKKICKAVSKLISIKITLGLAYSLRCINKDVYIKVSFINLLTSESVRLSLLRMIEKIISDLFRTDATVYMTKYNNVLGTSTYQDEPAFVFQNCFSYDMEHGLGELDTAEFSDFIDQNIVDTVNEMEQRVYSFHSECMMVNTYEYSSIQTHVAGDETEMTIEDQIEQRDEEYYHLIINNNRARQIDIVCKYLPEETYINTDSFYELLCVFYTERFLKPVFRFRYMTVTGKTEQEFKAIWKKRTYSDIDEGYYFRMLMNKYKFKTSKNPSDFEIEYDAFIVNMIRSYLETNEGKLNDANWSDIVKFLTVGKYYTVKEPRGPKTTKTVWYQFVTEYDRPEPGQLYKWRGSDDVPAEIINTILDKYMPRYFDSIITSVFANIDPDKASNKLLQTVKNTKFKSGNESLQNSVIKKLTRKVENSLFRRQLDNTPDVIGVLNGTLCLDLYSDDPKPYLTNIESKFAVTKFVKAEWHELGMDHPNVVYLMGKYREIIEEEDAFEKIFCHLSTNLDDKCLVEQILFAIASGSNGKSAIADPILYLLGDYGCKPKTTLYTNTAKSGVADPDLMQLKGKRGTITTEFNPNTVLDSSRAKEITERTKGGRDLHESNQSFDSHTTHTAFSNYKLQIEQSDHGTWRRILLYIFKNRFVYKPKRPNEKLIDKSFAHIVMNKPEMASAFLYILVHYRCKLKREYNDDVTGIPSPTIERETDNYKVSQDNITKYIRQKLVRMYGFNPDGPEQDSSTEEIQAYYEENRKENIYMRITLNDIISDYKEWFKKLYACESKGDFDSIGVQFMESSLEKYIEEDEVGEYYMNGVRILGTKEQDKLKDEVRIW